MLKSHSISRKGSTTIFIMILNGHIMSFNIITKGQILSESEEQRILYPSFSVLVDKQLLLTMYHLGPSFSRMFC